MPCIIRKLENKRNWDDAPWLQAGDVQSAVSSECLRTTGNKLSIYVIDGGDEPVRRVLAALALTRDFVQKVDLAVVSATILDSCNVANGIRVKGETPDPVVNDWHSDLGELSASQVTIFAKEIKARGSIKRYFKCDVVQAIRTSLSRNWIETKRVGKPMRDSLERRGVSIS